LSSKPTWAGEGERCGGSDGCGSGGGSSGSSGAAAGAAGAGAKAEQRGPQARWLCVMSHDATIFIDQSEASTLERPHSKRI
jgi:hypothetical protein